MNNMSKETNIKLFENKKGKSELSEKIGQLKKIKTNNPINNKKDMKKQVFLTTVVFLVSICAMAQSQEGSYEVTVRSDFSPTISDAQQKINEKANIVDTGTIKKEVTYNIAAPVYSTQFVPEPIAAPKVGRDQIARLYRNFIKFGLGNYWMPYLDFEATNLRSTQYACGARAFHHSSWGKIKGYAPAHHSDSKIGLFGQKFFNDYTLYASVDYNHLLATCYGFQPDSLLPSPNFDDYKIKARDIRRQYHLIHANVDFSRNSPKDAHVFNQFYGIDYNFLTDNNKGTNEHQLAFKTDLNKDIKVAKITYLNIGGEIGVNYYRNEWSLYKNIQTVDLLPINPNNVTFNFKPYASLNYKEYFFKTGFNIVTLFPNGAKAITHLYPDIQARLHIVPNIFTVYAGIDGGLKRNSYLSYMQENPYLSDFLLTGFMDEMLRVFGGAKVGLSRSLSIGAKASYSAYRDMPFFFNDIWKTVVLYPKDKEDDLENAFVVFPNNTFHVLFGYPNLLNLHFDLSYTYKQQLYLTLNVDYNNYSTTENLLKPWYKPAFVGNLDMRYILLNKFVFNFAAFLQTGIYYPDFVEVMPSFETNIRAEKMRSVVDLNFGFEYLWSKRLAFFANVNNFTYQRNFYYHDYPSHRINCLFGVKYNFGGEETKK